MLNEKSKEPQQSHGRILTALARDLASVIGVVGV